MTFECKKLNYTHKDLEPYLSEENVRLHYEKHTKSYFNKTNELVKGTRFEKMETLEDVVKSKLLRKETTLYNNVCQAYNHQLYWENLAPKDKTGEPVEELKKVFDKEFKELFEEAANKGFGSYWCWVVWNDVKLGIITTNNADNPLHDNNSEHILLVVDGWEHSFYPTYFNDKKSYFKNIWNIINWDVVNDRYTRAK